MTEFDRTKQTVGNHTVLVTSWFDDAKQTWRASAPAYGFLDEITRTSQVRCANRRQAIDAVIAVLTRHFQV